MADLRDGTTPPDPGHGSLFEARHPCQRCGSEEWTDVDYSGCSDCRELCDDTSNPFAHEGLPPANGWKRLMPGRKPTYDHEWVSEIINQNNQRGRLLIERDAEIARLREEMRRA